MVVIALLVAVVVGFYAAYFLLFKPSAAAIFTYDQILGNGLSQYISLQESPAGLKKRFYGEIADEGKTFVILELLGQRDNISEINLTTNYYNSDPETSFALSLFAPRLLENLDPNPQNSPYSDSRDWYMDTLDKINSETNETIRNVEGNFKGKKITLSFTVDPQFNTITVKIVPNPKAQQRYIGKYQKLLNEALAHHEDMKVDLQPTKMTEDNANERKIKYTLTLKNIPTDINGYGLHIDLRDTSEIGLVGSNIWIEREGNIWKIKKGYGVGATIVANSPAQLVVEANFNYKLQPSQNLEDYHRLVIDVLDKDSPYNNIKVYNQKYKFWLVGRQGIEP